MEMYHIDTRKIITDKIIKVTGLSKDIVEKLTDYQMAEIWRYTAISHNNQVVSGDVIRVLVLATVKPIKRNKDA